MTLEWRPKAQADAGEMLSYIAADDVAAARRLFRRLRVQAETLISFPEMGRIGRRAGTRELPVSGTQYVLAYEVSGEKVVILRLLHGARRWPRRL